MLTFFDYLDHYLVAYHQPLADPGFDAAIDPGLAGGLEAQVHVDVDVLAELALVFGPLEGSAFGGDAGVASPADPWLSGQEWSGEATIGGTSFTSGTIDPSGEGNSVYSVDGEVLDLPG